MQRGEDAVISGGLFGGFEGHKVARDDELDEAISSALISVDANVLLSLYRYPDDFSSSLLATLDGMKERIFVSHQALVEFWRNRTSALADRARARAEVEGRLGHCERSVRDAIDGWAKKTAIDDEDLGQARELVNRQFEVLRQVVVDNHRDDGENYPSPGEDPIVRDLEKLLDGRVGSQLPPAEYDAAVAEGQRRHAHQEPPGYREQLKDKVHLPEGVAGDYLVWTQSMAAARVRGLDLLLVTADEKDDWYWRSRDAVIGPRPELGKEFWDLTRHRLFLLTPIDFLRRYQELGGDVSESALAEAERQVVAIQAPEDATAERRAGEWNAAAVQRLLAKLDAQAPVQAAVIRAAAANGGSVDRATVYSLGSYSSKRMLRGFTRPVRRISRLLQETGDLDLGAPEMLSPRYDRGVQADSFRIPEEVVKILTVSSTGNGRP